MIRILAAAARVNDQACNSATAWKKQLEEALAFGVRNGTSTLKFIAASETALRHNIAEAKWDILHLMAPLRVMIAARYASVDFESSGGSTRAVSGRYLCDLLVESGIKIIVLYSCGSSSSFESIADELAKRCSATIVSAHDLSPKDLNIFLAKLHAAIANGELSHGYFAELPRIRLWNAGKADNRPLSIGQNDEREPVTIGDASRAAIQRKRALGQFDVFLCHNHFDKPSVRKIAEQLEKAGILPWLDEAELPPGIPWVPLLERQIASIGAAAVFFGATGIGPWQEEELNGFLHQFVKRRLPVIPVLLPDAPLEPELPIFLAGRGWVDLRSDIDRAMKRLVWAITGVRPENW